MNGSTDTSSRHAHTGAPSHTDKIVLLEKDWQARALAHETRVRVWTDPAQARASRGEKHPVYDFLFHYYAHRPAWLRRWHPGLGVCLAGDSARTYLTNPAYHETGGGVAINPTAFPRHRHDFLAWLRSLLTATRDRTPAFGCFGLHEWAMVYRQTPEEVRHNQYPLRYPPGEIARIVESQPVRCSHFDAFRFFTAPAKPLNKLQPTRETAPDMEQRGCLHANMDLYKWAFKLTPFVPAELVADCFELAVEIRELDMRASPYDIASLGFPAVPVETPEGRAIYEQHQRAFAARSEPLRARLLATCEQLLAAEI